MVLEKPTPSNMIVVDQPKMEVTFFWIKWKITPLSPMYKRAAKMVIWISWHRKPLYFLEKLSSKRINTK